MQSIMGVVNESNNKCLPKTYKPGDKYGRDELTRMFICYTREPKKFPFIGVREWLFPLLHGGGFTTQDPMRMDFEFMSTFTLEQMAKAENMDTRNITVGIKNITPTMLPKETQRWFQIKRQSTGFQERIEYQLNKIRESNYDTTVVTPENEPIVFESVNKELHLTEGWHRLLAIFELIENGEITNDQARVYCVIVYRNSGFKRTVIEKPLGK
jgi:hypothetical protein